MENRGKTGGFQLPACCQINKNHAKLNRSAQRLHLPLLENMSHTLTKLHFLLPGTLSATFTSLWIGNKTCFQEVPPLPKCALEKTRYTATRLFAFSADVDLDSVLGPRPTFIKGFGWHSRGYFGKYKGSGRYFYCELLVAHLELSALLLGTLQPTLGHSTQAAPPAPPRLLTDVEGVGGLLVPQLQVQDIRCLRVMAEPQGHSQDDASGQLGRKQREARVTHCSSHMGPRLAVFWWEQTCFSSSRKYTRTSFLTIIPPLQHALCPTDHEPYDPPCFTRRPLIPGMCKALSSSCRRFLSQEVFYYAT